MNGYDMKIIRLIFKICYYYVMSFLVTPITFSSSVIDSMKEKMGQPNTKIRSIQDYVSYETLIDNNLHDLRKLMVNSYNEECSDISETNLENTHYCERCNTESIFTDNPNESEDETVFTEFKDDDKTYSLKVHSIGKYDLRKEDVDNSHIHINLKRKTVDIVGEHGTNRLPLRPNQIVVSNRTDYSSKV